MATPLPFADTSSYPVRTTERLLYFVDGEAAFAAIEGAIEGATRYVYVTCAYASLTFRLRPPDGASLLDLLAKAAERGVRVALLIWLPEGKLCDTIPQAQASLLDARGILSRWDKAKCDGIYELTPELGCHHQKTFVIDGLEAFVGGINMVQSYFDTPLHLPDEDRRVSYDILDPATRRRMATDPASLPLHDAFTAFTGPAVTDVEANFVERWNGASDRHSPDSLQANLAAADPSATTRIQVVRTIAKNTYPQSAAGERSIREAMLNLVDGAARSIYFENQYFFDDDVVARLHAAGERRVRVVGLLCRHPDAGQAVGVLETFLDAGFESKLEWASFNPALRQYVQLYSPRTTDLPRKDIYVHAKLMIVDDRYLLLGSANIAFTSLDFHSEMCTLVDSSEKAIALRRTLFAEHLCISSEAVPASFEDGAQLFAEQAALNQELADAGKAPLGRVYRLVPLPVKGAAAPDA